MKKKDLPINYCPSVKDAERVLYYLKQQHKYILHERTLFRLFRNLCPHNSRIEDIMIKCSTLNDIYNTNIFDVHAMAEHILYLDIDERLKNGDYSLVKNISKVEINEKKRTFYSFATKYCSHHQPTLFAIYDSYVEKVLMSVNKRKPYTNEKREELKKYEKFMSVILSFQKRFELTQLSLKDLDQYLWQLGKWHFNPYKTTFKYYEKEDQNPFLDDDIRSHFWHGEMMFVTTKQDIGKWMENSKKWFQEADEQIRNLADRLTPEQLGIITYISHLFGKWLPYDNQEWLINY